MLLIEKIIIVCYNNIMLHAIKDTQIFNNVKQDINAPRHAYLFYGEDGVLNIELAKVFIASIFCGKPACFSCEACKRIEINKNNCLKLRRILNFFLLYKNVIIKIERSD